MSRLYTVVDRPVDDSDGFENVAPVENPHPEEWEAFCMERYGEVKPFFMPKSGQIYKSRSSAVERASLINYWGGNAIVLECTPEWRTLEAAKADRARRRIHARIVKLVDQLEVEREKFQAVTA